MRFVSNVMLLRAKLAGQSHDYSQKNKYESKLRRIKMYFDVFLIYE